MFVLAHTKAKAPHFSKNMFNFQTRRQEHCNKRVKKRLMQKKKNKEEKDRKQDQRDKVRNQVEVNLSAPVTR